MEEQVLNTVKVLKTNGTILYPTDTVWGIGCDATDKNAVSKIYDIKQRKESKSLIILVDSIEMLKSIIPEIPEGVRDIIHSATRPTSIIYENPIGLAKNVIAKDNTVAIRIAQDKFCQKLIKQFGKPIVSTSANISGTNTPQSFSDIEKKIIQNVDYVVDLYKEITNTRSSRIIKCNTDGSIQIIRN